MPTPKLSALLALLLLVSPAAAQVTQADLEERDGLWYERGDEAPYTGPVAEPGRMQGRVEDGLRAGEWVWWYPSGEREFMVVYENGKRMRSAGWHPNGRQETAWTFADDRPHGVMQRWDDEGRLREERPYETGRLHGTHRLWDHTGALLYTADYAEGKRHGPSVWWYPNGNKRWETAYAEGERTGTWSQWSADGDLLMQSEWEAGTLVRRHNPHANH